MYQFHSTTIIKAPLKEVFDFFSNPSNLEKITPHSMQFRIVSEQPLVMKEGLQINYRLKIRGFPCGWSSLISKWDPPHCFADSQTKGPYRLWQHTHRFKALDDNTTRMVDEIKYNHIGGKLINRLFIKRDIEKIFNYRTEMIQSLF